MKLSKSFMKKILILILSVFVLVPVILMVFGLDKPMYEGFFNMEDNGVTVTDPRITALVAPVGSNAGEISNNSYDVESGNLYCINGNITCANGYDVGLVSTGADGINVYTCVSNNVDNTRHHVIVLYIMAVVLIKDF